jgi:AraC family transcriptional regulator
VVEGIQITLDPARLGFDGREDAAHEPELRPAGPVEDRFVHRIAIALQEEVRAGYPQGPAYAEALGAALLAHLLRRYPAFSGRRASDRLPACDFKAIFEYIEAHIDSPVSLHQLSGIAGKNVFTFLRAFRAATGLPPHQYVLRRRIERAKQLLVVHELSIAEVAVRCGFYCQSHFTNAFHRLTQATPGEFRTARMGKRFGGDRAIAVSASANTSPR